MPHCLNVPSSNGLPSPSSTTMSLTDSTPVLTLSDIMNPMSPSPVPVEEHSSEPTHNDGIQESVASPEPLTECDVLGIRHRLQEMGLWSSRHHSGSANSTSNLSNLSSREKELVHMIIRLIDPLPIDPAQLDRQAETIARLTAQRNYIINQAEEERRRWNSEKETWDRTAEALLTQRARPPKSEEAGRQQQVYETETRALQNKLHDAQRRLSSLESELHRLKPLLFMQPYLTPRLGSQDKGKAREVDSRNDLGSNPEDREVNGSPNKYPYRSNYGPIPQITVDSPPVASSSKVANSPLTYHQVTHHRRRPSKNHKRHVHPKATPISADAYTEHLLLAARKVGRTRVAHVSGIVQFAERENELLAKEQEYNQSKKEQQKLEKARLERLASGTSGMAYYRSMVDTSPGEGPPRPPPPIPPRTPVKKTVIHYGPRTMSDNTINTPIVFVHTNTPIPPPGTPTFSNVGTPGPLASTSHANKERGSQQKILTSNPPTPLDSLLDAARMMDDGNKRKGKGRPLEEPESPVPNKRRKLSSVDMSAPNKQQILSSRGPLNSGALGKLDRVRSALDVLADQAAAAFNEPEQSDRRASIAAAAAAGKATEKEKEKEKDSVDDDQQQKGGRHHTRESSRGNRKDNIPEPHVLSKGKGRARGSSSSSLKPRTRGASLSAVSASASTSTTSASGRPIRQARRPVHAPVASTSASARSSAPTATKATSKPRGRPKGSTSKSRTSTAAERLGSTRVISPPVPRVIARPMRAMREAARSKTSDAPEKEKDISNSNGQGRRGRSRVAKPPSEGSAMSEVADVQEEQQSEPMAEVVSPVNGAVTSNSELKKGPEPSHELIGQNAEVEHNLSPPYADSHRAASPVSPSESSSNIATPSIDNDLRADKLAAGPSSPVSTYGHQHSASSSIPLHIPPAGLDTQMMGFLADQIDSDADAEADIDEDAEGEPVEDGDEHDDDDGGEDENEEAANTDAEARHNLPRSKSPPPPDPPPSGPGGDSAGDGGSGGGPSHDGSDEADEEHDADAEGEMEDEDAEGDSMRSCAYKATKDFPMFPSSDLPRRLPSPDSCQTARPENLSVNRSEVYRRLNLNMPSSRSPPTLPEPSVSLVFALLLNQYVLLRHSEVPNRITHESVGTDNVAKRSKLRGSRALESHDIPTEIGPSAYQVKWSNFDDLLGQAYNECEV